MRFARRLAPVVLGLAFAGTLAWFWPAHGDRPFTAWVPGEGSMRGTLMRLMEADPDIKVVAIHRANVIVIQSDAALAPWKVLAVGAIPFSVSASDAICRS